MNINISGHHLDITPSLHEHITKKFLKIKTHFDYVIDVKFILSVEKLTHIAEATIHLPNIDIHAESTDKDMYHGIDLLIGKLDRQVIKYKEKIKDHHKSDNSYKSLP